MMGGAGPMGGGMPPGMPPGGPNLPGIGTDPQSQGALAALDQMSPKSPNPTQALQKVEEALKLAHQLIMSVFSQVSQWNPKVAKDLHTIGRQLVSTQMDMKKEQQANAPPPDLGAMGAMGMPPGGPLGEGSTFGQNTPMM